MRRIFLRFFPFLGLILITSLSGADFSLVAGSEAGFRTDKFETAGAEDRSVFFVAPSLSPSLSLSPKAGWSPELTGTASANFYTEGTSDYAFESGLFLVNPNAARDLKAGLSAGYYTQPGNLDPDQPEDYSQFTLLAEYRNKARNPLRLSYSISVLNDAEADRTDMKHKAKGKITLKPGPSFMAGLGAGLGANFSNTDGYGYFEADFPLSATWLINDDNFLTAMVYLDFRWYDAQGNGAAAGEKKTGKGKFQNTGEADSPSSRTTAFFISYTRALSERLDAEANVDISLFDSDFGVAYTSTKIYAGVEWRYGSL